MYTIGTPYKASQGHYRRDDIYQPTGNLNSVMVSGLQDTSLIYKHWQPGNYSPACSCCYLGITHSEAKHNVTEKSL